MKRGERVMREGKEGRVKGGRRWIPGDEREEGEARIREGGKEGEEVRREMKEGELKKRRASR